MNARQIFQRHLAQTSPAPLGLHVTHAEGCTLRDAEGKEYLDLIGGISVANVGHRHPRVVEAIKAQADRYLHTMVYGELVQSPQVEYAQTLTALLPPHLDCIYFTNSGAEATEGALKLARRLTGRPHIVAAHNSYHGATLGALSLIGDEMWRAPFRPLIPGVLHRHYNGDDFLEAITEQTACVILETVQAEAGVIAPDLIWLRAIRERCTATGALLVFDEIQCGFGRTGTLWGFQQYSVEPDILLLGKALGGGMPLGAFVSSHEKMQAFTHSPVLGHITTFGGHPVCCAAGLAGLQAMVEEKMMEGVETKSNLFSLLLNHPKIIAVRAAGLLIAVELKSAEMVGKALARCLEEGLFSDWFLFAPHCIRIAPPLVISETEIRRACNILLNALDDA
jgi:acetylornithine/succinyldiaminopimelate/putrescine aminotransferase